MKLREWGKLAILAGVILVFGGIEVFLRYSNTFSVPSRCECSTMTQTRRLPSAAATVEEIRGGYRVVPGPPYLSYQPPGNGWNNQRIALENALVLAKLLNRTLIVHPLAPHSLGEKLKAKYHLPGYLAYNMLSPSDLLPPSSFLDLELLSTVLPVVEINSSHPQFLVDYGHLTWKNVCHSAGFGYWVNRPPSSSYEVEFLSKQRFIPNTIWKEKCPAERERDAEFPRQPIVRYVSDLAREAAEMLYFEQGTLFATNIRFWTRWESLEAQNWVVDHVRYGEQVRKAAQAVGIGPKFNAIHVRRKHHVDKTLSATYWLDRMTALNFSTSLPLYIATDLYDADWFAPFLRRGYRIFTARDFRSNHFNFSHLPTSLRADYLGLHEQCICELAERFVPSPSSTFAAFISRRRGEVEKRDGLMLDTLHTHWVGHQLRHREKLSPSLSSSLELETV